MSRNILATMSAAGLLLATACGQGSSGSTSSAAASTVAERDVAPDPSGWCHDVLKASDGATQLLFDYQPVGSTIPSSTPMGPAELETNATAWLNVLNSSFTGTENVTVTVIGFTYDFKSHADDPSESSYQQVSTAVVNLAWDGTSKFTAQAPTLPLFDYRQGDDSSTDYMYQFAVNVDGNWLTDPVSGTHNFQYIAGDQGSGICDGQTNGL